MTVYCSSDWHCPPQGFAQQVKEFTGKPTVDADLIVGGGGLSDLMEYPYKQLGDCKAVQEFVEELEGNPFVYVAGNHDRAKYIRKVTAIPNIQIMHREFPLKLGETTYRFTHGHEWG
jgi:predicted phosphodiesterase